MPISISFTGNEPPQLPPLGTEALKLQNQLKSLSREIDAIDRTNYRDEKSLAAIAGTVDAISLVINEGKLLVDENLIQLMNQPMLTKENGEEISLVTAARNYTFSEAADSELAQVMESLLDHSEKIEGVLADLRELSKER